jgi:hypothetical protein
MIEMQASSPLRQLSQLTELLKLMPNERTSTNEGDGVLSTFHQNDIQEQQIQQTKADITNDTP